MDDIIDILASTASHFRRRPGRFIFSSAVIIFTIYFAFYHEPIQLDSATAQPPSPSDPLTEIPHRIWQIFFGYTPVTDFLPFIQTWIIENQDYAYTLVSDDGANAFARKHYADRPEILQPFLNLKFPVLRSDLLRYMLLETEGGVYSDLDTRAVKPVRDWLPQDMRSKVHAIIGIEYDQLGGKPEFKMTEPLQFCQWTMVASRGHPILKTVVKDVIQALHSLAESKNTTISGLEPVDDEVIEVSGPVMWTKAVMRTMSKMTGTKIDYRNMTGMQEPRLFGDVLVLPIDGFGSGQPHSNSNRDGIADAYVRHMWKGSWKHGWGG